LGRMTASPNKKWPKSRSTSREVHWSAIGTGKKIGNPKCWGGKKPGCSNSKRRKSPKLVRLFIYAKLGERRIWLERGLLKTASHRIKRILDSTGGKSFIESGGNSAATTPFITDRERNEGKNEVVDGREEKSGFIKKTPPHPRKWQGEPARVGEQ